MKEVILKKWYNVTAKTLCQKTGWEIIKKLHIVASCDVKSACWSK